MKRKRNLKRGSAIAFGAALALVLVVLGIGFMAFSMYMGAQNETKNAVDAGVLNIGRQVIDNISVQLDGSQNQEFYRDVTDNLSGKVSLRNINRVWGKALLVGINSDAAKGKKGDGQSSAEEAYKGAKDISDALAAKLTDFNNLTKFFTQFADANSVRMIGTNASIKIKTDEGNWQTSLMDRTSESNLQLVPDTLPIGYNLNKSYHTSTKRSNPPSSASGMDFLSGYVPMDVAENVYWQVPFQYDEKPHLVSDTPFNAAKQPPNNLPETWSHPVPNAFSAQGETQKAGVNERATSWVQTNPRQVYPLQFPNGFVRIILKQNTIQWNIDGFIPTDSSTYPCQADSDALSGDGIPYPFVPICASGSGDATVGNEYSFPVLYFAITGFPKVNANGDFMQYLLQRCREMRPGSTMTDLTSALMACPLSSSDEDQTFYLYPTPLGSPLKFACMAENNLIGFPAGCDKDQGPEGTNQSMESDSDLPLPNVATETWVCLGETTPDIPTLCLTSIDRTWKPGTGFKGGCLGELTVHHKVDATVFTLVCSCP